MHGSAVDERLQWVVVVRHLGEHPSVHVTVDECPVALAVEAVRLVVGHEQPECAVGGRDTDERIDGPVDQAGEPDLKGLVVERGGVRGENVVDRQMSAQHLRDVTHGDTGGKVWERHVETELGDQVRLPERHERVVAE